MIKILLASSGDKDFGVSKYLVQRSDDFKVVGITQYFKNSTKTVKWGKDAGEKAVTKRFLKSVRSIELSES